MSRRLPLSVQQQWLWDAMRTHEHWQCAAGRAFRLSGALHVTLLEQCLREVVARHGALRTRVVFADGVASQELSDCQLVDLPVEDVASAADAQRRVEAICDRRINPAIEPLWSVRLLRIDAREHWLAFSMHRLIGDCVSIDQTYRETMALYAASGQSAEQRPAAQYSDYALWQQRTDADWIKRHEAYWQRHLAAAVPVELPIDSGLPAVPRSLLAKAHCSFGTAVSKNLLDLARTLRTLPAMPMLAVYTAVLWRWSAQDDFVLPFNTAGRPTDYKSAIGYFSYVLHLRVSIDSHLTFRELVSRLANEFFSSMAHQDFGRIARRQPELLAGTVFQWVTSHPEEASQEQVSVREFGEGLTAVPPGSTGLEVTVFDTPTELRAFGSYRADCFNPDTVGRFMADLRWAAALFVGNPDTKLTVLREPLAQVGAAACL